MGILNAMGVLSQGMKEVAATLTRLAEVGKCAM